MADDEGMSDLGDIDDFEFDHDHDHGSGDGGSDWGILEAGVAYGLAGHLFDKHAEKIIQAQQGSAQNIDVHLYPEPEPEPALINAAEGTQSTKWDHFIGQEPLKRQLRVHIDSAKQRGVALDHVLLATGCAGHGKTEMARIIADEMGTEMIMLVPPFHKTTLYKAARELPDGGILVIDEIHRLAEHGRGPAENLLHMLEEKCLYLDEGKVQLADITVIGATTDQDKLPETVVDRFPIKPHFQPYSLTELCLITARFQGLHLIHLPFETSVAIAAACRGTPRVAREFVVAARDLIHTLGRPPTPEELLEFKETDPDGMTRQHKDYITAVYQHFERTTANGEIVYVAGEYAMRSLMRETKDGLYRLERFLMERGYLDRTPSGRRLTPKGVQAARRYLGRNGGGGPGTNGHAGRRPRRTR